MHQRILVAIAGLSLFFVLATSAHARLNPHKPQAGAGSTSRFECGTYKGNEAQHVWLEQMHEKKMKDVRLDRSAVAPAGEFVFDDVWVVEDDGTLLFSGTNLFDTDAQTFTFTPNGTAFDVTAVAFNFDATLGPSIATGDDGSVEEAMLFSFTYGGSGWGSVHVGGNGIVSFGAIPNPAGFYDEGDFFSATPKIAPFYMDLNPAAGGSVHSKAEATRHTLTWSGVPEFGTGNINTVQLVLHDDGSFDVTFNGISSTTAVNGAPIFVGFHPGAAPPLEVISFDNDLPYTSGAGAGVYEDYLNLVNPRVNEVALLQRFYQTYPDSFFQIIFFTNFQQTMGGFANELNISNDVTGIGLGIFDFSSQYGSNGVLESRCNMNQLSVWPSNPASRFFGDGNNYLTIMGQEAGHRWGAFVHFEDSGLSESNLILGRADAHWSYFFDNDHSSLEGGNWDLVSGSNYTCPTQIDFFHPIDEYLFGLRTPVEVAPTFFLSSASNNLLFNRDDGTPIQGASAIGTPVTVTIESIIAVEGARTPTEPNEEHDLRQAFILIHQNGTTPTQPELDKIALFRSSWEDYFEKSCDGRLTCNTSVTTVYDVASIKGTVINKLTDQPIDDFTAHSLERGFDQPVPGGGRYTFRYQADANSGLSESVTVVVDAPGYFPDTCIVDIDYGTELCKDIELLPVPSDVSVGVKIPNALYANYPNPFNPTTTIRFDLNEAGDVSLAVYNIRGQIVRTLVQGTRPSGHNTVEWDGLDDHGRAVASGVYVYRIEADGFVGSRKMVLLK